MFQFAESLLSPRPSEPVEGWRGFSGEAFRRVMFFEWVLSKDRSIEMMVLRIGPAQRMLRAQDDGKAVKKGG